MKEMIPFPKNGCGNHPQSPAVLALDRISRQILYPALQFKLDLHYALLNALYGLSVLEADLLALLYCRDIGRNPYESPNKYLKAEAVEIDAAWNHMEKFHYIRTEWTDMERVRKVDEQLEQALKAGQRFDKTVNSYLFSRFETLAEHLFRYTIKPHSMTFFPEVEEEKNNSRYDSTQETMAELGEFHNLLLRYNTDAFASRLIAVTDGLCPEEEALLVGLIRCFQKQFTKTVREDEMTGLMARLFKTHLASLMEKGLVTNGYIWHEKRDTDSENYRIAPAVAEVFRGRENVIDKRAISKLASYIPHGKMEAKGLFFPEKDLPAMERLYRAAEPSEYRRIISELKRNHLRPCLSALMYGPPGTGKTELVRQIAIRTGRSLIIADAPKLGGVFLGEGEVNFREFFQVYRYACAVSECCPILLLDEADGLLGKRISDIRSNGEKHANTIQNVILEELNSLPGIFIATTNLVENMDEAMKRRFMIKAEFHLPDADTRKAIWMEKIPTLQEEEAAVLAERFPISGGLIDNVASVAIVDGILYNQQVTLGNLMDICGSQVTQNPEPSHPIGFHHC